MVYYMRVLLLKTLIGPTPLKHRRPFLLLQTVFNILLIYFSDGLVNFDDIMLKRQPNNL